MARWNVLQSNQQFVKQREHRMEGVGVVLKYGFAIVLLVELVVMGRAMVMLVREKARSPHQTQQAAEE
jgi:hypothetical protein